MAHAVKTTHEESDSMDESSSQSDGSEWEYRGTMVLQSKQKAHSNTLPKVKKDEVRLLIDSGCDTLAMMHRRDGFDWRPGKMRVNEATEGRSTLVGCKGQVELEFPMGGKLAVSEAIYSKDFRHNLCGTSTLGKAGFSTLMHEGKVFLIDAKSMGELPKAWKVRACEGVDRDTGLPFIVMKRQKSKRVGAALKKEAQQKKEDATQVKQRNASWRSHREDSTPINLAKSYPERKVSRGDSAMGGEEFRARAGKLREEEELKEFKKGQEQQRKFRTQGMKTESLPSKPTDDRQKGVQSAEEAQSEKMVDTRLRGEKQRTDGHSINTAVMETLMSRKLQWRLGNSSGNGRTRLLVPPRFSC
jgi:hypothetical protein